MISPICTIFMLIVLCFNTVSSQNVLSSVTDDDLQHMSTIVFQIYYRGPYNPKNYWNLFCDSAYQTNFSNTDIIATTAQDKNLLLTLKSISKTYPNFCQNTTRKTFFSLFALLHPDTAIRYSVCQTSMVNAANLYCAPAIWTNQVLWQISTNSIINKDTQTVCNSLPSIQSQYTNQGLYGPLLDQFVIDLNNSQPCVSKQYTINPYVLISSHICKTPSGLRSNVCNFIGNQSNIDALCKGFLTLNNTKIATATSNTTTMFSQWMPAFGSLVSNQFFVDKLKTGASGMMQLLQMYTSHNISLPLFTIRQQLCTNPLICPLATPSCP